MLFSFYSSVASIFETYMYLLSFQTIANQLLNLSNNLFHSIKLLLTLHKMPQPFLSIFLHTFSLCFCVISQISSYAAVFVIVGLFYRNAGPTE